MNKYCWYKAVTKFYCVCMFRDVQTTCTRDVHSILHKHDGQRERKAGKGKYRAKIIFCSCRNTYTQVHLVYYRMLPSHDCPLREHMHNLYNFLSTVALKLNYKRMVCNCLVITWLIMVTLRKGTWQSSQHIQFVWPLQSEVHKSDI